MVFNQDAFAEYLHELRLHLFGDDSIDEIISKIEDSHRARRFVMLYLIKNRETFYYYHKKRTELGFELLYDTIISALFYERERKPAKQELINLLAINLGMVSKRIEGYPLKEFDKDLNAFLTYWGKSTGNFNPRSRE
ncbi:hypothetical protein M3231_24990 [Neobacillus mesonae]|nr:hypothetical protein [Neobacillus mesonae]